MVPSHRDPVSGFQLVTSEKITDFAYWYSQGESWVLRGCYLEALRSFEEALVLDPDADDVWICRATCLIHLQRYAEALESCDRLLAKQPDHPQGWLLKGVALQRLGRYRQAYHSYDRALGKPQPRLFSLKRLWRSLLG